MNPWARVPLRLRVALAFAATTALALGTLGVYLEVRVSGLLEEQALTALSTRAEAVAALPAAEQAEAVRALDGEWLGQLVDVDGAVIASSAQVRGPLLAPSALPGQGEVRTIEAEVWVASEGERSEVLLRASHGGDGVVVVGMATEDVTEVLEGLRTQLVVGGVLALGLASALGYVVAGAALRPVELMRRHAETISAHSASDRLPLPGVHDELHRLGSTLNDMLDRLDTALRQQRQFVAEAGHELRTPLALLRTELDLAVSRPRSPDELGAFLASASEEVDRLSALVDHLLLLAQADEARLDLDRAPVDLGGLLERVAARFDRGLTDRGVRVLPGPDVVAVADAARLDQVLSNLVDNALRHGRGTVTLSLGTDGARALVEVADEGGVLLEEPLFDRFRRGSQAREGGRGLGLSLVRSIVAEHGGSVVAEARDGWTVVRVSLPRDGQRPVTGP